MKTILKTSIVALLSFATTPALAQNLGSSGFDPFGYVSLNYIGSTASGDGNTYAIARGGFRWDFGGNFGLDYGLVGFADDEESLSAHYLALAYRFGDLRLSVGAPMPAFDEYGHFRFVRQLPLSDVSFGPNGGSFLTYVDLFELDGDQHTYGLRVDGGTSGLRYAVSLHGVTSVGDVFGISASAEYEMANDVTLTGGLEYLKLPSDDNITEVKLGVAKDFGRFDLAFQASHANESDMTIYELSGSYDVNDRFNVGASYVGANESSPFNLVALDASYKIYANASVTGSITKFTESSSGALFNVGLRYDF